MTMSTDTTPARVNLVVSPAVAARLVGGDPMTMTAGTAGRWLRFSSVGFERSRAPARNVIGIVPGTDPALRGEYVAIGAHNDHIGIRYAGALDHDSLRAFNIMANGSWRRGRTRPRLARRRTDGSGTRIDTRQRRQPAPTATGAPRFDLQRRRRRRLGHGGVLEIAEAFAKARERSRSARSSSCGTRARRRACAAREYFTDHPTVPRDSIVAQLNMDMIGRGGAMRLGRRRRTRTICSSSARAGSRPSWATWSRR